MKGVSSSQQRDDRHHHPAQTNERCEAAECPVSGAAATSGRQVDEPEGRTRSPGQASSGSEAQDAPVATIQRRPSLERTGQQYAAATSSITSASDC